MRISIVTPCLNRAETIGEAIESVLAQGHEDMEHIVVDGGSTDGTLDVLARFSHLTVLNGPDRNLYDAINKGLSIATGDVVGLLNGDDLYTPDCFSLIEHAFEAHTEAEMVTGGASLVEKDPNGRERTIAVHNTAALKALRPENIISGIALTNSRFVRLDAFRREKGFDIRFPLLADKDFWARLFLSGAQNVVLQDVIYVYRRHPQSLTMSGADIRRKISDEESYLSNLRIGECEPASTAFGFYRLWRAWSAGYATLLHLQRLEVAKAFRTARRLLHEDPLWPARFARYAVGHWREREMRYGKF